MSPVLDALSNAQTAIQAATVYRANVGDKPVFATLEEKLGYEDGWFACRVSAQLGRMCKAPQSGDDDPRGSAELLGWIHCNLHLEKAAREAKALSKVAA